MEEEKYEMLKTKEELKKLKKSEIIDYCLYLENCLDNASELYGALQAQSNYQIMRLDMQSGLMEEVCEVAGIDYSNLCTVMMKPLPTTK